MVPRARRVLFGSALLLGVAISLLFWHLCELPPIGILLRQGLSERGGPTGRMIRIEGVEFIEIGPGAFRMGTRTGNRSDENGLLTRLLWKLVVRGAPPTMGESLPVHWVEFRRPFWIARTEVTNEQYRRFDEGYRANERLRAAAPADQVSWEEASGYCDWLSTRGTLAVRLPSESEWEYCCRAGSRGDYCYGQGQADPGEYAWYLHNSGGRPHPVKTRRPNTWGLYDMHGNVLEWCADTWHDDYSGAPGDGSAWREGGAPDRVNVYRGGCFNSTASECRAGERHWALRGVGAADRLGFRPAADLR
jgi:formylglycine-generating enzyme required for sulfatase activity